MEFLWSSLAFWIVNKVYIFKATCLAKLTTLKKKGTYEVRVNLRSFSKCYIYARNTSIATCINLLISITHIFISIVQLQSTCITVKARQHNHHSALHPPEHGQQGYVAALKTPEIVSSFTNWSHCYVHGTSLCGVFAFAIICRLRMMQLLCETNTAYWKELSNSCDI